MESYATAKGQIVIPAALRRKFGIKEGTRIAIEADERTHCIVLRPITRDYIQNLRGKRKGMGLMKALMAGKKVERESSDMRSIKHVEGETRIVWLKNSG